MDILIRILLGIENVPENVISDIEKNSPALAKIFKDAKAIQPQLKAAQPHIQALQPFIDSVMDFLKKDGDQLIQVLPTVEEIAEIFSKKLEATKAPAPGPIPEGP